MFIDDVYEVFFCNLSLHVPLSTVCVVKGMREGSGQWSHQQSGCSWLPQLLLGSVRGSQCLPRLSFLHPLALCCSDYLHSLALQHSSLSPITKVIFTVLKCGNYVRYSQ